MSMRLAFLLLLSVSVAGQDASPQPSRAEATRQLDEVFEQWDTPDSPGMSVAILHQGSVLYERGFGMANLEHAIPNGPETVFRIGSTSKQFTAACLAMLAFRGDLDLDADVRTVVPELPEWTETVTFRHLVHHTSGIPDYVGLTIQAGHEFDDHVTPEDTLAVMAEHATPLEFKPGDSFAYSNSNYFLMSVIVERVSGKSLRAFADEHIFVPLGMASTHYHDDYNEIVRHRADGHMPRRTGDGWTIANTTWEQVGDGGVFTTVRDLAKWDEIFYDNPLEGGATLIDLMLTQGVLNDGTVLPYAFGLNRHEERGKHVVSHGGAWVGFRADMVRYPEHHVTVIVLSNCATVDPSGLARRLSALLL